MNKVTQKLIAALFSLLFSLFVIQSTINQEYPSAFQFAFIIGILCLIPTTVLLIQIIPQLNQVRWIKLDKTKHFIAIFLIIVSLQVYEMIGFYVTGWILFVSVSGIYSIVKIDSKYLPKFLGISLIYMGIIYILFSIILKVQTPTGILL